MDLLLDAIRRVETRHFWFRGLRRFVRPLLSEATAGCRNPTVLDCGSGTGVNLPLLARFGSVSAVDLSAYGVGLARQAGFVRTARATVASLPFRSGTFDLCVSFDVLYCLTEDNEQRAVDEMFRVLKPGGAVIVNVAAMQCLRGDHSVLSEELRRYNRQTLRTLLTRSGFRIERLTYTNTFLFPIVFTERVLERRAGLSTPRRAAEKMRVPSAPLNQCLAGLLAVEGMIHRVLPMPFGSSLLCLARKP
jgi:SAM-dependent methyltransferase